MYKIALKVNEYKISSLRSNFDCFESHLKGINPRAWGSTVSIAVENENFCVILMFYTLIRL